MIHAFDENMHPAGLGAHWQESWYFNWADPSQGFFGAARLGFRLAQNQIDGLVFAIHQGRPFFAYPALNVKPVRPWPGYSPADGLGVRRLMFTMIEPLKLWRLQLSGRDNFDLFWEAFTQPYAYGGGGITEIAGNHFEQSGLVRGAAHLRGKDFTFSGMGQRDKSWGVRDWAGIAGWTWISAQFGEDLSVNLWQAPRVVAPAGRLRGPRTGGEPSVGGFVHCDGATWPIERADLALETGRNGEPRSALIHISSGRRSFSFEAKGHGVFPLAKNGLWMYELFATFTTEVNGLRRTGAGVIEHAFHVGRLGYLPRVGEIAATLRSVFLG